MIKGDQVAGQNMGLLLGFPQFVLGALHHDFMTEFDEFRDHFSQVQGPGPPFYEGHIVDPVRSLQFRMLVKLVDHQA